MSGVWVVNYYVQEMNAWRTRCVEAAQEAQEEEFANYCDKQNQDWQQQMDDDETD
jgi:hypothetical protein